MNPYNTFIIYMNATKLLLTNIHVVVMQYNKVEPVGKHLTVLLKILILTACLSHGGIAKMWAE